MDKKLYRVMEGKMVCGVCTGVAEYFKLDVNIVRIATVVFGFCGVGLVAYIAAAFILPEKPEAAPEEKK